jgi:hypothetical protein
VRMIELHIYALRLLTYLTGITREDTKRDRIHVMNVIAHFYILKICDDIKQHTLVQSNINVDYVQSHSVERIIYVGIFITNMV